MTNIKHRVIQALEAQEQRYYLGPAGWGTALRDEYNKAASWVRQMPEEATPQDISFFFKTWLLDGEFERVKETVNQTLDAIFNEETKALLEAAIRSMRGVPAEVISNLRANPSRAEFILDELKLAGMKFPKSVEKKLVEVTFRETH